ncbi:MAG: 2-amino-4-hydroxy-6-hydroxymethyldihydropteridine diphosphokinase [Gammaproteobacteria bacterium]|nr:2-amino-4-hydroxy-6-hydroxymethyldihydropteridine diphosphokinase [Gammaproteobacteria bacterium]
MPPSNDPGVTAYVGLGSNLDDPVEQLRAGLAALAVLPETALERCSSFYLSAPVGRHDQPDFVNAVCRLRTRLAPAALMQRLLAIEADRGRRRGQVGGPRTLDLDLLLYGDRAGHEPGLTLPHPRLHERAFVLYPLYELAPDLAIPGRGALANLLPACAGQKIEKLTR